MAIRIRGKLKTGPSRDASVASSIGQSILAINGGSSSIRFALFGTDTTARRLHGKIQRIGSPGTELCVQRPDAPSVATVQLPCRDFGAVIEYFIEWLNGEGLLESITAIGHRVVHGLRHTAPERITPELLAALRAGIAFDSEHLPAEIQLIEALRQRCPQLPQVACFDTAFHRSMPRVATLLAIPRRYQALGVQRYGFHGLSYSYLMQQLMPLRDPPCGRRVILAHLGNGASMAAVCDGACLDTSMGFTPAAGLPMSTRSGDLDPGVLGFLASTEQMTASQFNRMVTHESGLLGLSETSSDVRDLLAIEASDSRAAEAVNLFCYEARKRIGSFAAVLGGLDTVVFSAGIGENSPQIRARICSGLEFLGIELDAQRNADNAPLISSAASRVAVRVIPTDEEVMIAQIVRAMLWGPAARPTPDP